MITLPKDFEEYTRALFGEDRYEKFIASFSEAAPVSVRLNPFKQGKTFEGNAVPWCENAFWLNERPQFTLDPLLHAGCYYVQEAGSMFLDKVLRQYVSVPIQMLDLCAAPGGKSTLARAALPEGSMLYSNEPDRRRANILMENLQKQGHPDVAVTNNFAADYARSGIKFDVVLCDVPCSGEGMFRKDEGAISEWSIQNVVKCQTLQRSIVADIWTCLKDGGIMIYSTCTFNTRENEENVKWIMEELGAEILSVDVEDDWNITGSLYSEFREPVYRFIPGITRSEGLFMAVLRKHGNEPFGISSVASSDSKKEKKKQKKANKSASKATSALRIIHDGHSVSVPLDDKKAIPQHAEALLYNLDVARYPRVELSLEQALSYLRHEAITLPLDVPRGFVIVTFQSHALGFVKNIGNRANNLYPQEWRIRK